MAPSLRPRSTTVPAPVVVPPSQSWDGNDGNWSTFSISVGSPGQDFRVLISTGASSPFLPLPLGCQATDSPENCPGSRGVEPFQNDDGVGFSPKRSSTWELYGLYSSPLEERLGYKLPAQYGYDTVTIGTVAESTGVSLKHQLVAGFAEDDFWLGFLGLSTQPQSFSEESEPIPSLFQELDLDVVPSYTYSYGAGAYYRDNGVGSLILGGFDDTRFEPDDLSFDFAEDSDSLLTVAVQSIIGQGTLDGVVSFTTDAHLSLIDSSVPHIWLPENVCDRFVEAFGLEYDALTDLFLVNDTMHSKLRNLNPNITFKLGNSKQNENRFVNIVLPYAAFDLQASAPIYEKPKNYFPIRRSDKDNQYTLGRAFLQEAYLIVDYTNQNFSLSQAAWPDSEPKPHIVTIFPPGFPHYSGDPDAGDGGNSSGDGSGGGNGDGDDGWSPGGILEPGAIAGVVIGLLLFVALMVCGFLFLRRRRLQPREMDIHELPGNGSNDSAIVVEEALAPPSDDSMRKPPIEEEKLPPQELPAGTPPEKTGFTFYAADARSVSEMSAEGSNGKLASIRPLSPMSSIRPNSYPEAPPPPPARSTSYPEDSTMADPVVAGPSQAIVPSTGLPSIVTDVDEIRQVDEVLVARADMNRNASSPSDVTTPEMTAWRSSGSVVSP